ncbi:MAG: LCP family protein [Halanaerobium sp.]
MLEKLMDWKYISLIIILVLIGISIPYIFNTEFSKISGDPFIDNKINILAVGYDSEINGASRADTIILISLNVDTNEAGIIFLPRDTYIDLESKNFSKLNSSHVYGGIELTRNTIEEFLAVDVDYYLETDFIGFEKIIDRLGGIEVDVEKNLNYDDKAAGLNINISEGRQNLDGEEALKYVRYRDNSGDIGRIGRQQKFIDAVLEKVISPSIITKLPGIIAEINSSVNTNIPLKDINPFIKIAKEIDLSRIESRVLPGNPEYINGISYWVPDKEEIKIMVENLIKDKSYIKNKDYQLTILNGLGKSGVAGKAADLLEKYGFQIEEVGNADNYNYQNSIVKYYSEQDKKTADRLAELLNAEIEYVENESDLKGKMEVILGQNYDPSV